MFVRLNKKFPASCAEHIPTVLWYQGLVTTHSPIKAHCHPVNLITNADFSLYVLCLNVNIILLFIEFYAL
jgi:hypothetical protein